VPSEPDADCETYDDQGDAIAQDLAMFATDGAENHPDHPEDGGLDDRRTIA